MSFFQKSCPAPFPSVSCSFPELHLDPQCCLYNLLERQPENSWPVGKKYCIISNHSRYSSLHLPCFLQLVQQQYLSVNPLVTMPGRSPSVGIPSKAIGLPRIIFGTLGVSPVGHLGPNPYYPSPKVIRWTSLVAQMVKHLPTMWETLVQSCGWEDPLEKEMAIHSSILAWKIPWMEEPGRLQSMGSQRVGHD